LQLDHRVAAAASQASNHRVKQETHPLRDEGSVEEQLRVSGEVGTYHERLVDLVQQQGIELEYNERIAPAQGVSYGGKIALLPGQSKAEEFSTLVHELAHLCCVRSYVV